MVCLRKECNVVRLCKDSVKKSHFLVSKYEHKCFTYVDWYVYWCGKFVNCENANLEIFSNRRDRVPILENIHSRGCTSHSFPVLALIRKYEHR